MFALLIFILLLILISILVAFVFLFFGIFGREEGDGKPYKGKRVRLVFFIFFAVFSLFFMMLISSNVYGYLKTEGYVRENGVIKGCLIYPPECLFYEYKYYGDGVNITAETYVVVAETEVDRENNFFTLLKGKKLVRKEYVVNRDIYEKAKEAVGMKYVDFLKGYFEESGKITVIGE